jgi:aminoglycoside phosphotransferase (APT) family kinase protein
MLDDPSTLGPCRLRRTKFKPGTKLTAWFDAGLGTSASRPAAVSWWGADRGPWPGAAEADAEAEARARGCAAPFEVLGAHVPDLHMRVHVAPLDPTYPGLVPMSDPAHVRSVLGYPRPPRITALRYRPGQRHVLRYQPDTGAVGPTLFAKLYPDERGVRYRRSASAMADLLADGPDGVAARPDAYLTAERALVFAEVAGSALSRRLGRTDATTARGLWQGGAVLRRIHDADPRPFGPLPERSTADEVDEVARASAAIAHLSVETGAVVADVLARTREVLDALPQEDAALTHGDFKTDHLLVGARSLTLIDFDKCAVADPALDIAKLLADLRWWLAGDPAALAAAQERFLAGYGSSAPARQARARALEPLFMVKLAARRVQVHQPRWSDRTAGLVEHADRLLRDLARA